MANGKRGKGKPLPPPGLFVDASAAGAAEHATDADIEFSRAIAKAATHQELQPLDWIPQEIHDLIVKYSIVLCVDIVIRNNATGEFLLVKRQNEPLAGEWWVVGGEVRKGEVDMEEAARRKALQEIGIDVFNLHPIGYYTEVYYTEDKIKHTLSIVFSAEIGPTYVKHIKLDDQSSEWKFDVELPARFRKFCNLSHKMFI